MKIIDFSKYKELLNNILKESLDNKLKYLEKRSQNHLIIISSTKEITNSLTSIATKMNSQILTKNKIDKGNSINKNKKHLFKNINSPKPSIIKSSTGFKTPLRPTKKSIKTSGAKTVGNQKKLDSKIRNTIPYRKPDSSSIMIKKIKSFIPKKNNNINNEKEKANFNKTFMHSFHHNTNNNNNEKILKRKHSTISYNTKENEMKNKDNINKNFVTIDNSSQIKKNRNKNIGLVNRILKNVGNKNKFNIKDKLLNKTFDQRKTKIIKSDNSSSSSKALNKNKKNKDKEKNQNIKTIKEYNIKNDDKDNKNKIRIISMETNLQQDDQLFNYDEPLLISPITDNDFKKSELILNNKNQKKFKNIIEYFKNNEENYLKNIFEYLEIKDLLLLNKVSKYFNKNILNYFIKKLNEEKNKLEYQKILTINIPERNNFKNFEFSKGTSKSMELLNESIMNKIFQEEIPPRNEILFIYYVFFQLINNPIKNLYENKNDFWEKCRLFFLNESKGKIGNFLKDYLINNELDISDDNLYKLYKLVINKLYMIVPSYFNKVCSTTALMTFYLKDILTYLGISMEEEDIKQNGYWTYSNIINSIDKKINIIIKYK